jgi:hypothetical protein
MPMGPTTYHAAHRASGAPSAGRRFVTGWNDYFNRTICATATHSVHHRAISHAMMLTCGEGSIISSPKFPRATRRTSKGAA